MRYPILEVEGIEEQENWQRVGKGLIEGSFQRQLKKRSN